MPPAPLRVIINDRPLRQALTGVGHYIRQLLLALRELEAESAIRASPVLFPAAADPAAPKAATPSGRTPSASGSRAPWWMRRMAQAAYAVYFRHRARGHDLYHEPNHIPIRSRLPTITTVHDLSVLVHPEWHPADRVRWYEREFHAGAQRTARFIAASEFTRRELIARIGIPAERIDVTYQAARSAFTRSRELAERCSAAARYGLNTPYFLFVGTLEPRKNLPLLLDAYAALPVALRQANKLVIIGPWGWKAEALHAQLAARAFGDQVRLLGYLEDDELAELYASSRCLGLVWPTFYEGFGLPPLEAMACGAAVVTSNVASLPEVVGDAGVLLDPHDPVPWTAALRRLAEDSDWLGQLRARSAAQAANFSWRRCAMQTAAAYRAVAALR